MCCEGAERGRYQPRPFGHQDPHTTRTAYNHTCPAGHCDCTDEGGSTCSIGTDCPAAWDDAADTFSCCQEPCSNAGGDAIITIDPYETEVMDSDLGDIL